MSHSGRCCRGTGTGTRTRLALVAVESVEAGAVTVTMMFVVESVVVAPLLVRLLVSLSVQPQVMTTKITVMTNQTDVITESNTV